MAVIDFATDIMIGSQPEHTLSVLPITFSRQFITDFHDVFLLLNLCDRHGPQF
jgi:hypothetical protein